MPVLHGLHDIVCCVLTPLLEQYNERMSEKVGTQVIVAVTTQLNLTLNALVAFPEMRWFLNN